MKFGVYPYRTGSKSARAIAEGLGGVLMKRQGSRFVPGPGRCVINWGAHDLPNAMFMGKIINSIGKVGRASNKIRFFEDVRGVTRIPPATVYRDEAREWLREGKTVVVRHTVTGQGGAGIEIIEPGHQVDIPDAPLYTAYVPKDSEWRLHFVNGELIHTQRKVKDPDIDEPKTWKVRSHNNGFIYQQNNPGGPPEDVVKQAQDAFDASGLDFGALDVIYNKREDMAYVLEANTAPGCDRGSATARAYVEAFQRHYG